VLEAAGTKWNFLPFKPGLVGGHCIGVDPYYLTYKAEAIGYHPEIILSGRRLNDSMGEYVSSQFVKAMIKKGISIRGAKVLVMGLTFKEDTPDIRNTRVVDIVASLKDYGCDVDVYDPWIIAEETQHEYGITPVSEPAQGQYDGVVVAVAHRQFREAGSATIRAYGKPSHVMYDLKHLFPRDESDMRL
jgi:UDP-N-acetyl-D-galactosamine dehydrogenase